MAPLPVIKLGLLVLKTLSKPISSMIRSGSKKSPVLRKVFIMPLGQLVNRMNTIGNMWRLGMGMPKSYTPLAEAAAVELGAETVAEVTVVWGIPIATLLWYESWSSTKSKAKENALKDRLANMESEIEQLKLTREVQTKKIERLESSLASPGAPSSAMPQQQPWLISRIFTSQPVDEAVKVVAGKVEFLVTRQGTHVIIEPYENALKRGPVKIRERQTIHVDSLIVRSANYARSLIYRSVET